MSGFYILDENRRVVETDSMTWARWFEREDRHIAHETIGDATVSTVFLGIDHRHRLMEDGKPIVFETMIFGGPHDGYQERCSTWDEAEDMHRRAVYMAFQPPEVVVRQ